mgnify:CR=1 FL=1
MNRAVESNVIFRDAWDEMNREAPGFAQRRGGILEASFSGAPMPFFNLAFTMAPPGSRAEWASAVDETTEWAGAQGAPWLLVTEPETLGAIKSEAEALLIERGFAPMMQLMGMEAGELTEPSRAKPEGTWRTEQDAGAASQVIRLNEAAYQMSFGEPGSLVLEQSNWWRSPERLFSLLEVDQKPAASTAVFAVDGTRYVALVATDPSAQRRGYADAVMRDVLARSLAAGMPQRTYLHATAAGRPVYERMGYRVTAEHTVWMRA